MRYQPAAVAIPTSIEQIPAAVLCEIGNNLRVTAKGGGHNFGSHGIGGEGGHLVIVLDRMHRVSLQEDGTAKIQAGARTGHVATKLYNQGNRAIPHGQCPR